MDVVSVVAAGEHIAGRTVRKTDQDYRIPE